MSPFGLNEGCLVWGVKGWECFGENLRRVLPRINFDVNGDAEADRVTAIAEMGDGESKK